VKIKIPSVDQIVQVNKYVCVQNSQAHQLLDLGKIESALNTAFYPGSEPFLNGGIARIAGALCFYLTKAHAFLDGNKRTAALSAILFMNSNELDLLYPENSEDEFSELAMVVNKVTASEITKDDLVEWFERHKVNLSSICK